MHSEQSSTWCLSSSSIFYFFALPFVAFEKFIIMIWWWHCKNTLSTAHLNCVHELSIFFSLSHSVLKPWMVLLQAMIIRVRVYKKKKIPTCRPLKYFAILRIHEPGFFITSPNNETNTLISFIGSALAFTLLNCIHCILYCEKYKKKFTKYFRMNNFSEKEKENQKSWQNKKVWL